MTRWKLTIEYKGTGYAGWQRQVELPSIQQSIEEAIYKFSMQKTQVFAAGRTDSGVHALGQVAHVDLAPFSKPMNGYTLMKAINAHLLPQPIAVIHAEQVDGEFRARFSAQSKLYHYRIINRTARPTVDEGLAWNVKSALDIDAMQRSARMLTGHHDFTTFRDTECQAKSPVKTLGRLEVSAREYDSAGGREIIIAAEARSFLHHMVRNMVGTLVMAGKGKWTPDDVRAALEARDRTRRPHRARGWIVSGAGGLLKKLIATQS